MTIGLLGSTTPEARLATIRAAFSRGDATMATDAAALSAALAGAAGVGRERVFVVALVLVIAIVVVFATILIAAHRRQVRRAVDPTRTHATAAAAIGLARMAAPTMSAWAVLPVASMTASAPVADTGMRRRRDGDGVGGGAAASGRDGAPVDGSRGSAGRGGSAVDDAPVPDREGADAGSYATLADHPASDETMATPAEPPSDPDGWARRQGRRIVTLDR